MVRTPPSPPPSAGPPASSSEGLDGRRPRSAASSGEDLRAEEARLLARIRELDVRIDREQSRPIEAARPRWRSGSSTSRSGASEELKSLTARMEREYPQYAALKYPRPCTIEEARACLADDEVALLYVLGVRGVVPGRRGQGRRPADGRASPSTAAAGRRDRRAGRGPDAAGGPGGRRQRPASSAPGRTGCCWPRRPRRSGARAWSSCRAGSLGLLPFELLVEPADAEGRRGPLPGRGASHPLRPVADGPALRPAAGSRPARARAAAVGPGRPGLRGGGRAAGRARRGLAAGDPLRGGEVSRRRPRRGVPAAARHRRGGRAGRGGSGGRPGEVLVGPEATEAAVKAASESAARWPGIATSTSPPTASSAWPTAPSRPGPVAGRRPAGRGRLPAARRGDGPAAQRRPGGALAPARPARAGCATPRGSAGLARAFLYAGSRGVLCSLWQVDDQATAELMADVYAGLKAGQPGGRGPAGGAARR